VSAAEGLKKTKTRRQFFTFSLRLLRTFTRTRKNTLDALRFLMFARTGAAIEVGSASALSACAPEP
jgi:hypothetical protein